MTRKERLKNNSFETLRIIAAVFIVLLHYQDFSLGAFSFLHEIFRFSFALSGFLLAEKYQREGKHIVLGYVKRIIVVSLFWNLFYFAAYFVTGVVSLNSVGQVFILFFKGEGAYHLWFFTSLWVTALVFYVFGKERINFLLVFSTLLYLFGVLAGSYKGTYLGILIPFSTRDFIFFSSLPFFVGVYLNLKKIKTTLNLAIAIFAIGFLFHSLEVYFLRKYALLMSSDYVFSTFLMGIGGVLIGLKRPKILEKEKLSSLGKYSMGLYVLHVFVYHGIHFFGEFFRLEWIESVVSILTIFVGVFVVIFLRKINFVNKFL